jgi:hypothetical protein
MGDGAGGSAPAGAGRWHRTREAAVARRWSDLSSRQRGLIIGAAAVETALKVAMLVDLRRRDASQVRGPRWLWASSAVLNSAGIAPLSYFLVGRRR